MRRTLSREEVFAFLAKVQVNNSCIKIDDLRTNGFEGDSDSEVVIDWMKYQYEAAPNQFLAELYEFASNEPVMVEGIAKKLFPCKCCEYETVSELDQYDICRWCGWEDDGNPDPDRISSVNRGSMRDYRELLRRQNRISLFHRWANRNNR